MSALGLIIGKTLVMALAKELLGNELASKLFENVFDWSVAQVQSSLSSNPINEAINKIAKNLKPVFEHEMSGLDEGEREPVMLVMYETIADFTSDLAIGKNLNSKEIAYHLREKHKEIVLNFSANGNAVYSRLVDEACSALVKVCHQIPDYAYERDASLLHDQDRIIEKVDSLQSFLSEDGKDFEDFYRRGVQTHLDKVDFFGFSNPQLDTDVHNQSLSVAYVTLEVKSLQKWGDENSKPKQEVITDPLWSGLVDQVFTQGKRFIIQGQAGAGKTTLIRWLAVRAAKRDFSPPLQTWNNLIPFVIQLRDYKNSDILFPAPEDFPKKFASTAIRLMPSKWVHNLLYNGKALVLIDGIDEVNPDQREVVLTHLKELVNFYDRAFYVITSRPLALKSQEMPEWQHWIYENDFKEVEFKPMGFAQTEALIRQWHTASFLTKNEDEEEAVSMANGLIRMISTRKDLQRLASNPLLCAMLCVLHSSYPTNLPRDRRQLYEECIKVLLENRDQKRQIDLKIDLTLDAKNKLIRYLAYWMLDNGTGELQISTREADLVFNTKLESIRNAENLKGEAVRRYFVERANLLNEVATGQIAFVHRSFQEYLAAKYSVLDYRGFKALVNKIENPLWRDVIILALGEIQHQQDLDNVLTDILNRAKESDEVQARRIRLMATVGMGQNTELPSKEVQELVENAVRGMIPSSDEEVELLAELGEKAVEFLPYNPAYEIDEVINCIKTFALIGSEKALQAIEVYSNDEREKIKVTIADAWDAFDRKQYARQVLSKSNSLFRISKLDTLDGFEYLSHLKDLRIHIGSEIYNINPIINHNLVNLSVCWENLKGLTFLNSITNLLSLDIGFAMVPGNAAFWKCTVNDLTPLKNLGFLSRLRMYGVSATNVTPLCLLSNLKSLALAATEVEDLDPIKELTSLVELSINRIMLSDVYDEEGWVGGDGSKINDLSFLAFMTNLEKLVLGSIFSDIKPLQYLTSLKTLFLDSVWTSDISPISNLSCIEELYIHNSVQIDDLSPVSELKTLRYLSIDNVKAKNVNALEPLQNLTKLRIRSCNVRDLGFVLKLPKLTDIYIEKVPSNFIDLGDITHPIKVQFWPNSGKPEFEYHISNSDLQVNIHGNIFEATIKQ